MQSILQGAFSMPDVKFVTFALGGVCCIVVRLSGCLSTFHMSKLHKKRFRYILLVAMAWSTFDDDVVHYNIY